MASACYSRVMRIKPKRAMHKKVAESRVYRLYGGGSEVNREEDRIATRRKAYRPNSVALRKRSSKCGGGGTPIDVDRGRNEIRRDG